MRPPGRPSFQIWGGQACLALGALSLAGCMSGGDAFPTVERSAKPGFYAALSRDAEVAARDTVQVTLEKHRSGKTVGWRAGSEAGEVTPLRTYKTKSGTFCRVYVERIEQPKQERRRTACRTSDGVWAPVAKS